MNYTYDNRKQAETAAQHPETTAQQPSLDALRAGTAKPTREQMGHRVDLPDAMRAKMENAFGADFSAVRLYESRAVADAGAGAMTQGTDIAFAPGLLDFQSFSGQALLGHELSHVVSQSRGEARGSGFLSDPALEAKADREGALAASGQTVSMPSSALSSVGAAPVSAPMQAGLKKPKKKQEAQPAPAAPTVDPAASEDAAPQEGTVTESTGDPGPQLIEEAISGSVPQGSAASQTGSASSASMSSAPGSVPPGSAAPQAVDPQAAPPQVPNPTNPDPWNFASSPKERRMLPSNGVGFLLGMENLRHPNPQHRAAFQGVLDGMKGIAVINGNRRHIGGQAAYDAMMGNAYQSAIDGLKRYREVLRRELQAEMRDLSKSEFDRRIEYVRLVNDLITRASLDQAVNEHRKRTTITEAEHVPGGGHGAINQVHVFARGDEGAKQNAYFKQTLPDNMRSQMSLYVEHSVMDRIGIPYQDAQHNPVDAHLSKREVAYSRLSSLMGSSVGIGAKLAQYSDGRGGYAPGVLMEEAKGKSWTDYNWQYYGPDADPQLTFMDPAVASGTRPGANWGERLKGTPIVRKSTTDHALAQDALEIPENAQELDAADPDYQRQMNEMFLLDTLATHTDRHSGNYHVNRDENGKISVKTMDNDITFGSFGNADADKAAFGKRGQSFNYGGLPAKMQIDANMAAKIKGMKKEMLDRTFADVLSPGEIDSLWTRFQMMKEYVAAMEQEHLVVDRWDEETAKRETALAGGAMSHDREDKQNPKGYAGNNYYQRQMLMLHAADSPYVQNGEDFLNLAEGRTWGVKHKKDIASGFERSKPEDLSEDDERKRSF